MNVYGMSGCASTKPGGTAEVNVHFCPSKAAQFCTYSIVLLQITEAGAFFIPIITSVQQNI